MTEKLVNLSQLCLTEQSTRHTIWGCDELTELTGTQLQARISAGSHFTAAGPRRMDNCNHLDREIWNRMALFIATNHNLLVWPAVQSQNFLDSILFQILSLPKWSVQVSNNVSAVSCVSLQWWNSPASIHQTHVVCAPHDIHSIFNIFRQQVLRFWRYVCELQW